MACRERKLTGGSDAQMRREVPEPRLGGRVQCALVAGEALERVRAGGPLAGQPRPVGGLQGEQLAGLARGRPAAQLGGARRARRAPAPPARSTSTGRGRGPRSSPAARRRRPRAPRRRRVSGDDLDVRLLEQRRQPVDALRPPVAEQLGVDRDDATSPPARPRREVRRVRARLRAARPPGRTARRRPTRRGGGAR